MKTPVWIWIAGLWACGLTDSETPDKGNKKDTEEVLQCDPAVVIPDPFELGLGGEINAHAEIYGTENPDPFHVHLSYPASDTSTSIAFVWRTDVDTQATMVQYGVDDALDMSAEGSSYRFGGIDGQSYRVHELKLCEQLEPNKAYRYRVGGEGHWSPTYTFRTPPTPGPMDEGQKITVGFAGDSRGGYEIWAALLSNMVTHEPDVILFTGDIIEAGTNQQEWDVWFDATGEVLSHRALIPAHGNHEYLAVNYFAQWSLPHNEEWFELRYGGIHIVSLNDTVRDQEVLGGAQATYMDEAFGGWPDSDWRLVMHHKSMYSACTRHGSNEGLREDWGPVVDAHEVDLVVAGHNHIYERSVPIRRGERADDGTVYVVTGGAGAPLYTGVEELWFGEVAEPVSHYIIGTFGAEEATFVVRDLSENVIDEFTLIR